MVALLIAVGAALAGEPLTWESIRTVEHGRDVPRVIFHAHEPGRIAASASCDGRSWRVDRAVGGPADVELRFEGIAAGTHACAVHVAFTSQDGSDGEADLELQVASLLPLALSWSDADHVVGSKQITLHAPRTLAQASVRLVGAKGRDVAGGTVDLTDPTAPIVRWDDADAEVVKVTVEAADEAGMGAVAELFPWYYEIPHEDVVFDSAQDVVRADQTGKLDAAWTHVAHTVDLYGDVVRINLYVAGFTDTVGDAAYNQALSDRRARAIARWFASKGFPGVVWYQGLGETHLAVPTLDATDEVRNRRAVYVLSASPPSDALAPRGGWRKL